MASDLNAHVIGLQEMGSPEAVRKIFPADEWDMVFSKRLDDDLIQDPDKLSHDDRRDIYTALVVRRSHAKIVGTERIALSVLGEDGRPTREGTAALIEADGVRFWVASIHLKSRCFSDNDLTSSSDCRTLAKQIPILEDWMDEKSRAGEGVVLMGRL